MKKKITKLKETHRQRTNQWISARREKGEGQDRVTGLENANYYVQDKQSTQIHCRVNVYSQYFMITLNRAQIIKMLNQFRQIIISIYEYNIYALHFIHFI